MIRLRHVVRMSNTLTHIRQNQNQLLHRVILTHVQRPRHQHTRVKANVKVVLVDITVPIVQQPLEVVLVDTVTAQHQPDAYPVAQLIDTHISVSKIFYSYTLTNSKVRLIY